MIYENIDEFLKEYDRDNVIFCYGNFGMVDFTKNLLRSARLVDMNIIFFALDLRSLIALSGECDVVRYIDAEIHSHAADYGTPEHRRCNWHKYAITNDILESGRTCIYMDTDIVVKNNFEKHLLSQYEGTDYDCLIQWNRPHPSERYCAGFYSMRPSERSVGLFSRSELKRNRYLERYRNDQVYFNRHVVPNKLLNIKMLDPDDYPVGMHYYKRHKQIDSTCNLIHFNFITKYENKIARMRKFGYWGGE